MKSTVSRRQRAELWQGRLLTALGVLAMTPDALLVKLSTTTPNSEGTGPLDHPLGERGVVRDEVSDGMSSETLLILRYGGNATMMALTFLVMCCWRGTLRRTLQSSWRCAVTAGPVFGMCNFCFVSAVQRAAAANVLFVLGTSPLLASVASAVLLHEVPARHTGLFLIVALAGIALVVAGGLSSPLPGSEFAGVGELFAAGAAVGFTAYSMLLRRGRTRAHAARFRGASIAPDSALAVVVGPSAEQAEVEADPDAAAHFSAMPALVVAGAVDVAVGFLAGGDPSSVDMLSESGAFIGVQALMMLPIAFGLISAGAARIPAPEVTMLVLLESVLGPIWVAVALDEPVTATASVGGALVVVAVAGNAVCTRRAELQADKQARQSAEQEVAVAREMAQRARRASGSRGLCVRWADEKLDINRSTGYTSDNSSRTIRRAWG